MTHLYVVLRRKTTGCDARPNAGWAPPLAKPAFKSTEENEMEQSVEKIIERNLSEVFNGRDADSRRAAIDELWDEDGVFIDPGGVHEGVEKINAVVELLSRSLKAMRSRSVAQDNLYMASVAFLGRMDRPMALSGLLALTLV